MKTSNYIIIAFFTFLFGGVFVLFLTAKIHHGNSDRGVYSEEKKMDPFSVVVAEPGAEFHLRNAENPKMLCFYQKPDTSNFLPFGVRNDTLFVFAYSGITKPRLLHEIYGRNIKCIVAKDKSYISLQEFRADTLIVKLNNAVLDAFFDKERNLTSSLSIQSVGSKINLAGIHAGNLDFQLNGTELRAWDNSIDSLCGTLTNHSNISIWKIGKINLEADSTSNYGLNK